MQSPEEAVSWQEQEHRQLCDLYRQGALDLRCEHAWNAQAYLEARGIAPQVAQQTGIGYLPPGAAQHYGEPCLQRWEDRLLFPLVSHDANKQGGFTGRLISGWQCHWDEAAHKAVLQQAGNQPWVVTLVTGWFWVSQPHKVGVLVLVHGPFDRLALLEAGFEPAEVAAVAPQGFLPQLENWLPHPVPALLVALAGDQPGQEIVSRLRRQLRFHNVAVEHCFRAQHQGRDWSERWRRYGADGLEALYAHHALLTHHL